MLQFNLLPDVKKEYIKVRRQKRFIVSLSILASGVAIFIVVILFVIVQFGQKKNISDLTKDIDKGVNSIKSIEDFDKILTIQNQLNTLPELHQKKPESSRLFNYLYQLAPTSVKISSVNVNFVDVKMEISGSADSLASINQFTDTLKFVKYKVDDVEKEQPFKNVVTNLNRNEESSRYTITLLFEAELFDNTKTITLIIPELVTTRSTLEKPDISNNNNASNSLFEQATEGEQ